MNTKQMTIHPLRLLKSIIPHKAEHYFLLSAVMMGLTKTVFPNGTIGAYLTLGIALLFFFYAIIISFKRNPLEGSVRPVYSFLVIWSIFLTIQVLFTGTQGQGTNLSIIFASDNMMPNLIPLTVMCYDRSGSYDIKYLFNILILLSITYIFLSPVFIPQVISLGSLVQNVGVEDGGDEYRMMIGAASLAVLFFPGFLALFCKKYWDKRVTIISYVVCSIQLFLMVFMARRGDTLMTILSFLCLFFIYNNRNKKAVIPTILKIVVIVLVLYLIWTNYSGSLFGIMKERMEVDSRSGLFDAFYDDMGVKDWIFGRGWFGQYFESSWLGKYRNGLECGYLHLILKGGLLYLIPYVIILLMSARNGLFRSTNYMCKAFGAICLLRAINLIPFGVPSFTIQEFVVWVGVLICNKKYYLQMSESVIFNILNSK